MNLYVGNLSFRMSENDLQELFSQFGAVASTKIVTDRESGRSKGFGFVEMTDDAEASAAIDGLNGREIQGRPLRVNEARPKPEGGGGGRRFDREQQRRPRRTFH